VRLRLLVIAPAECLILRRVSFACSSWWEGDSQRVPAGLEPNSLRTPLRTLAPDNSSDFMPGVPLFYGRPFSSVNGEPTAKSALPENRCHVRVIFIRSGEPWLIDNSLING